MYKTRSRNLQRGSGVRHDHRFYIEGIPTDAAERRRFFDQVTSDAYRPKLGGWRFSKFVAADAKFQQKCRSCGHKSDLCATIPFADNVVRTHEGTRLLIAKRMSKCPQCGGRGSRSLVFEIHLGDRVIQF